MRALAFAARTPSRVASDDAVLAPSHPARRGSPRALPPATAPKNGSRTSRLLVIDPHTGRTGHSHPHRLAELLHPRDLVVLNDASTLPASFTIAGRDAELRLVAHGEATNEFRAVVLGAGDFRVPTEARGAPPAFVPGDTLTLGSDLRAQVTGVDAHSARLVDVRFAADGAALLSALHRNGRPIQYSYVPAPLELWDVQNRFSARPWAFELASAGRAIDGETLLSLAQAGVGVAWLTHAAGISSTGSAALDARLPISERFDIPESTARAIRRTREAGGRILAVGTTVVRALEASTSMFGEVRAGLQRADLVIGPGYQPRSVDGILSGMHEAGSTHFTLLQAFAPRWVLLHAVRDAERQGYQQHEFGDFCVIWPGALASRPERSSARERRSGR